MNKSIVLLFAIVTMLFNINCGDDNSVNPDPIVPAELVGDLERDVA